MRIALLALLLAGCASVPAPQGGSSVSGRLSVQVDATAGRTRWFVDGRQVAEHGGRNHPVSPMAISFNLWFSSGGLLPPSAQPRVYRQEVDWVFLARNELLSPAEVDAAVMGWRRAGAVRHDGVPAAQPPLASPCNF